MNSVTPLRYPGGKTALAGVLHGVLRENRLQGCTVVEPFAGGGGASLSLLLAGAVERIILNDLDSSVASFWWAMTRRHNRFRNRVRTVPLTIAQWKKQRKTYRDFKRCEFDRGFAMFYLNRCNRSGIINNGGCIGGLKQQGEYRLDARFNRKTLADRIDRIAACRDRIDICNRDARRIISVNKRVERFFFIDPPYYHKGQELYLNALDHDYHAKLAVHLKTLNSRNWVLTYDDCPEIRKLYCGWARIRRFSLQYTAARRRRASELFIAPHELNVPKTLEGKAVRWLRDV